MQRGLSGVSVSYKTVRVVVVRAGATSEAYAIATSSLNTTRLGVPSRCTAAVAVKVEGTDAVVGRRGLGGMPEVAAPSKGDLLLRLCAAFKAFHYPKVSGCFGSGSYHRPS